MANQVLAVRVPDHILAAIDAKVAEGGLTRTSVVVPLLEREFGGETASSPVPVEAAGSSPLLFRRPLPPRRV